MKKTVLVLITFALVIAVAGSGFWLVHYFIDSREQRQTYETLAEEFVLESTPTPESNTPAENSSPTENSSEPAESVSLTTATPRHDLAALATENADCVGWLTIPDTGIDYPVMHTPEDPEHYLRRDFYGSSANGGTPFLDGRNIAQVEGQNLILYGHNMMDGSMFKPLINYLDADFPGNPPGHLSGTERQAVPLRGAGRGGDFRGFSPLPLHRAGRPGERVRLPLRPV